MRPVIRRASGGLTCGVWLVMSVAVATMQRATTAQPATGRITGVVVTDGPSPQPIRRAIVTLTASDAVLGHSAISDDAGRFEFTALPAGRFTLIASRASYLTGAYGATRPGRPGTALALAAGQQVVNVRLTLARGAVITGTVRDGRGRPVTGTAVRVEPRSPPATPAPRQPSLTTDDRGVYRAFGLAPGTYLVSASVSTATGGTGEIVAPSDAEVDTVIREMQQQRGNTGAPGRSAVAAPASIAPRVVAFAPVFHPDAFSEDDAVSVTVGLGDERRDVDITVRPMATATISGTVAGTGQPLTAASLSLVRTSGEIGASRTTSISADGSFRLTSVVPGRYFLRALSSAATRTGLGRMTQIADPTGSCMSGQSEVHMTGTDVSGVAIALRPCLRLTGRIAFAGAAPPPADLANIQLQLGWRGSPDARGRVRVGTNAQFIQSNGTFEIGVTGEIRPGVYDLGFEIPGSEAGKGWVLKSVVSDGRDVLDNPLVITDGSPAVTPVVVTFTDQRSALVGRLETAAQQPAVDYTVVAFTTNQAWWTQPFRRVRTARPATNGEFAFEDLPPGEYFLAALTDVEPDEWQDRTFLGALTGSAVRVTVGENERHSQNLRLAR